MRVSVAMAVYCGGAYLCEQIESILPQLGADDELVVSLDCADTESEATLAPYLADPHLRCVRATERGVLANFENALRHCQGEYLFLCDQDDVWTPDKVAQVLDCFEKTDAMLILHDAKVVDGQLHTLHESFFAHRGVRHGTWKNWWRNSYMGCCMAFRRALLDVALPFPKTVPMHDQWLGMLAEQKKKAVFLNKTLLLWRRHGKNASQTHHASLSKMIRFRLDMLWAWWKSAARRRRFWKQRTTPKGDFDI